MAIRMPAEHGAWGILLVPLLSSAAVARGEVLLPFLLLIVCSLGIFVLRGSYDQLAHAREMFTADHILLALVTLAAGAALLFSYQRTQLLLVGALGSVLFVIHHWLLKLHQKQGTEKRSLQAELAGVGLLTLTAPAAWISQRGALNAEGAKLWLLNVLFFAGGVLYVKYRVRGLLAHRPFQTLRERAEFAWPVLAYHALLPVFLVVLIAANSISSMVLAAFAPGILRAASLLFYLGRRFPIKQLGWIEVGQAVLFATLLAVAFSL